MGKTEVDRITQGIFVDGSVSSDDTCYAQNGEIAHPTFDGERTPINIWQLFLADGQASKLFRTLTVFSCISGVIVFFGGSTNTS